jgi:hypothetical protein
VTSHDPGPAPSGADARRATHFEVRIRTVISKALAASFSVPATRVPVPRNTVLRLRVDGNRDIAEVVRRLAEGGVEVREIRATRIANRSL